MVCSKKKIIGIYTLKQIKMFEAPFLQLKSLSVNKFTVPI